MLCAGTQRTLRLIGPTKTKLLLFTGRRLTGSEAVSWGLADVLSDNPEEVLAPDFRTSLRMAPHSCVVLGTPENIVELCCKDQCTALMRVHSAPH